MHTVVSVFAGLSKCIPGPSYEADSILALVSIVAQVPMLSVVFALVTVPVLVAVLEIIAVPVLSGGLCTRAVCGATAGLENFCPAGEEVGKLLSEFPATQAVHHGAECLPH